jgi:hypothetical protein
MRSFAAGVIEVMAGGVDVGQTVVGVLLQS